MGDWAAYVAMGMLFGALLTGMYLMCREPDSKPTQEERDG